MEKLMPQPEACLVKQSLEGPDDACGDSGVIRMSGEECFVALIDVLGHGPQAHQVALKAERFLADNWQVELVELTRGLHEQLKGGRGAVAALCRLDLAGHELSYVGVGNISTRIFGGGDYRFVPREGILGSHMSTPKERRAAFHPGDILVLTSDGVREHFNLPEHPDLLTGSARSIASNIVNLLGKGTDDASCLVLRYRG